MYRVVTTDGVDAGPVDLATLGQWAAEGCIGRDSIVREVPSGQQFPAGDHPFLSSRLPQSLAVAPPPPFLDSRSVALRNTSGEKGDVPPEVPGWNWGAFGMGALGLGWLWGINQRLTAVFAVLFPFFLLHLYLFTTVMFHTPGVSVAKPTASLLNFCYYGVGAYLGMNGSRLAWRHRRFRDIEDFKSCQRAWGWWALALLAALLILGIAVIGFFVMLDSTRGGQPMGT